MRIERACRITGVTREEHLRASHCKPWRDSSNEERLDGENGLLLTPNADHLFDRGFIGFEDNGDVRVSYQCGAVQRGAAAIPEVSPGERAAAVEVSRRGLIRIGQGRVVSFEALLVARVPPRLAVACTQMLFERDARDAARALDPHHVRLERPLPAPRKDDGFAQA